MSVNNVAQPAVERNAELQQKLADGIYYSVGKVMDAHRATVEWFQSIPMVQKFIVVGLILLVIFAIIYAWYSRNRLAAELLFASEPSFLTSLSKLHNTKSPYRYQYANGNIVSYLPARLFPTYNNYQFTWTFWIYVNGFDPKNKPNNDWGSYKFGQYKHILSRGSGDIENGKEGLQYPAFWLKPKENTLACTINTISTETPLVQVDLPDIRMNEWEQIALVLNEMSLSLYKNGMLEKTVVLPAAPLFKEHQNVYITNDGGFAGNLYYVQYFNEAIDPARLRLLHSEQSKVLKDYARDKDYTKFVAREFKVKNLSNDDDVSSGASLYREGESDIKEADKEASVYKQKLDSWL